MKVKLTALVLVTAAGLFVSCGTSKKAASQLDEANAKVMTLQSQNGQLSSKIDNLQKQVDDLSAQNASINSQFTSYKNECAAKDAQLKQLNETIDEFHANIEELQKKIEEAEAKFTDKGLSVHSKDGVIYVDMQDNLMYKSGSAKLSGDGKEALANLASVLNEFPKLKVIVVGNTDTMHVKGVADNWSLSTERANGVVRVLSKEHNIDPARLTAAGKGKFNPIADNTTAEGRAKNRRTEIVLNPDWDRLWESVKKE